MFTVPVRARNHGTKNTRSNRNRLALVRRLHIDLARVRSGACR